MNAPDDSHDREAAIKTWCGEGEDIIEPIPREFQATLREWLNRGIAMMRSAPAPDDSRLRELATKWAATEVPEISSGPTIGCAVNSGRALATKDCGTELLALLSPPSPSAAAPVAEAGASEAHPSRESVAKSAEHWANEMERAVETVSEAGAHVEIIDGNRAIASTLRSCANLLRTPTAFDAAIDEMADWVEHGQLRATLSDFGKGHRDCQKEVLRALTFLQQGKHASGEDRPAESKAPAEGVDAVAELARMDDPSALGMMRVEDRYGSRSFPTLADKLADVVWRLCDLFGYPRTSASAEWIHGAVYSIKKVLGECLTTNPSCAVAAGRSSSSSCQKTATTSTSPCSDSSGPSVQTASDQPQKDSALAEIASLKQQLAEANGHLDALRNFLAQQQPESGFKHPAKLPVGRAIGLVSQLREQLAEANAGRDDAKLTLQQRDDRLRSCEAALAEREEQLAAAQAASRSAVEWVLVGLRSFAAANSWREPALLVLSLDDLHAELDRLIAEAKKGAT